MIFSHYLLIYSKKMNFSEFAHIFMDFNFLNKFYGNIGFEICVYNFRTKESPKMRIAIYDNSLYINKQLVYLLKKYEEIKKICFSINSFHGNEVILSNKPNTDIAFLCVCDSVKTEIIRKFCLENSESKIIIVANIPDYRYAFQFHAFDFIPLPIREQNIFHTLDDALYYIANSSAENTFSLRTDTGILNVKPSQIHYFEHNSRKVIISTDQGEYLGNYTLKELSSKFRPYFFDSPHKSYLVNLNHIRYIKGFDIYLDSGTILPLAQKKAVYFKSLFQQFQEKRLEII